MKTAAKDYPLIPMSEITDEAREIAVAWMACEDKNWIGNKHKLASDIMNYARRYAAQKIKDNAPDKDTKKPKKRNYTPKIKICAACGSFAHGNPGHDIIT